MNFDRNPITPFGDVLTVALNRPVFVADYYAVDGITGKVSAWIDYNDAAHQLVQASNSNQVVVPAAHADFGGKLCATFTGAEYYVSNKPAAYYTFEHDGNGGSILLVCTPTNTAAGGRPVCTRTVGATIGVGLAFDVAGAGNVGLYVSNAAGAFVSIGVAQVQNVATYYLVSYRLGISPGAAVYIKSALAVSITSTTAPSGAAPANTLSLGGQSNGANLAAFRYRALVLGDYLGPAERAAQQTWILADTGITP
jgi:hypothetical protein